MIPQIIHESLEKTLHEAFVLARQKRHEFITVEHLLAALCNEPRAKEILIALRADPEKIEVELLQFVEEHTPVIPLDKDVDTQPTIGFQRVIQRAILHVQSSGKKQVDGGNVLIACYGEKDSKAVEVLQGAGVTRLDLVNYIGFGIKKDDNKQTDDQWVAELVDSYSLRSDKLEPPKAIQAKRKELSKVFISYCHVDAACLKRLLVHLRPLEKQKLIVSWSDQSLRAGDKWRKEIEINLQEAAVAILLVSADFLASDFIVDNELPPLLTRAESKGLRILPVLLKPCGFSRHEILSSFQAVNDPREPLLGMDHIGQEAIYNMVAEEVAREIKLRVKQDS